MKLSEIKPLVEKKEVARFVNTKGPNNTRGYDLQVQSGKHWKSLGFIITKPKKNKGKLDVYNGTKDVSVNLDKYTFEDIVTEKKVEASIDMRFPKSKKKAVHKEMDKLIPRWNLEVDGATDKGIIVVGKESDIDGFIRDIERNRILYRVIYVDLLG